MMFFWVWAPCGLAGRSQRFGEAYCLHLQGWSDHAGIPWFLVWSLQPWRWRQYASPKRWLLPASPHGAQIQKNIIKTILLLSFSESKRYSRFWTQFFLIFSSQTWFLSLTASPSSLLTFWNIFNTCLVYVFWCSLRFRASEEHLMGPSMSVCLSPLHHIVTTVTLDQL
jgi:hypothetical protein